MFVVGQITILLQFSLFTFIRTSDELLVSFGFTDAKPVFIALVLFQFIISPLDEVCGCHVHIHYSASKSVLDVCGWLPFFSRCAHVHAGQGWHCVLGCKVWDMTMQPTCFDNLFGVPMPLLLLLHPPCIPWTLHTAYYTACIDISGTFSSVLPFERCHQHPPCVPPATVPFPMQVIRYLTNVMSRTFEFQADGFAAGLGHGSDLRSALLKMEEENLSSMHVDPLFSAYHYSHPPLIERLKAIDKQLKKAL